MPEIARLAGVVIRMFYDDHPPPHFHATAAEDDLIVTLFPLAVCHGQLPPPVLRLVLEWASIHQAELLHNWTHLRAGQPPLPIPPPE